MCAESQKAYKKKFSAEPQPHVFFNDPGESAASMSCAAAERARLDDQWVLC